jgi:hypothetical protein
MQRVVGGARLDDVSGRVGERMVDRIDARRTQRLEKGVELLRHEDRLLGTECAQVIEDAVALRDEERCQLVPAVRLGSLGRPGVVAGLCVDAARGLPGAAGKSSQS